MDVHETRPTTVVPVADRLSVEHDLSLQSDVSLEHDGSSAHPGSGPTAAGLTALVLHCLTAFGEVAATTADSSAELERWLSGADPVAVDAVPVVVVPVGTWTAHLAVRRGRPRPARGVVVVCGDVPAPGVGVAFHDVSAGRESEVVGALGEALAGQAATVVRVLVG